MSTQRSQSRPRCVQVGKRPCLRLEATSSPSSLSKLLFRIRNHEEDSTLDTPKRYVKDKKGSSDPMCFPRRGCAGFLLPSYEMVPCQHHWTLPWTPAYSQILSTREELTRSASLPPSATEFRTSRYVQTGDPILRPHSPHRPCPRISSRGAISRHTELCCELQAWYVVFRSPPESFLTRN